MCWRAPGNTGGRRTVKDDLAAAVKNALTTNFVCVTPFFFVARHQSVQFIKHKDGRDVASDPQRTALHREEWGIRQLGVLDHR